MGINDGEKIAALRERLESKLDSVPVERFMLCASMLREMASQIEKCASAGSGARRLAAFHAAQDVFTEAMMIWADILGIEVSPTQVAVTDGGGIEGTVLYNELKMREGPR